MKLDIEAPLGASATIRERVDRLREEVALVARECGRDPRDITIVGVTKFQTRERLIAATAAGLTTFGENYVQEARAKFAGLPASIARHFIGHIQTNKAKAIVETFDMVQSVDRIEAGAALAKAASALGKRLAVLAQLNISPTERFGVAPAEGVAFVEALRALGLDVRGIMAIGPISEDRAVVRAAFADAVAVHRESGGSVLSLGMSGDWREAIAVGSTMIRIGTMIFGARPQKGMPQ